MKLEPTLLSDLVQDIRPGFASGENLATGVVQIRMNNLDTNGNLNWEKIRRVTATGKKLKIYSLAPGDILFNCTNSPDLVGKACLFQGFHEPVVFSNHFLRIRTNQDLLFPGYLSRWLIAQHPTGIFKLRSNQWVNQATFRQEDLLRLKIPLPPLPEQKRIAAILDKADAIRRKRQYAIKLADDFLRTTFLDMFGDPVTNPKGWKCFPLGKLCRIRRGASPRPISKFLGGTVPWIKIGDGTKNNDIYIEDTKDKIIQEGMSKSVYLEPGSLIFANCGVSLGFARIIKIGGCIHDGWLSFDQFDKNLNEIYLLKTLNSVTNNFRQTAPDGTQPNLNTSIMKDFRLPLPPKTMQDKFSNIVMKFQYNKQKINRSANLLEDLFNSLTQRAFCGEL